MKTKPVLVPMYIGLQVPKGSIQKRPFFAAVLFLGCAFSLPQVSAADFIRGDSNADGGHDISDAVNTLSFLFLGQGNIPCLDAADANDDGTVDLSDAVNSLSFLFLDGPSLPAPGDCGGDPTTDLIGCNDYAPCAVTE